MTATQNRAMFLVSYWAGVPLMAYFFASHYANGSDDFSAFWIVLSLMAALNVVIFVLYCFRMLLFYFFCFEDIAKDFESIFRAGNFFTYPHSSYEANFMADEYLQLNIDFLKEKNSILFAAGLLCRLIHLQKSHDYGAYIIEKKAMKKAYFAYALTSVGSNFPTVSAQDDYEY